MKFISRNTNLSTETIFEAIGESSRRVNHYRTGIHFAQKTLRLREILGDDGFRVPRTVAVDMSYCFIQATDNLHR